MNGAGAHNISIIRNTNITKCSLSYVVSRFKEGKYLRSRRGKGGGITVGKVGRPCLLKNGSALDLAKS